MGIRELFHVREVVNIALWPTLPPFLTDTPREVFPVNTILPEAVALKLFGITLVVIIDGKADTEAMDVNLVIIFKRLYGLLSNGSAEEDRCGWCCA